MMAHNPFTPDELIQYLKRSNMPAVVVEGRKDAEIYRMIEARIGLTGGEFLPCGGRTALLSAYARRAEIPANVPYAFVADSDMWIFTSTPVAHSGVIFTAGYSIENDVLDGETVEGLFGAQEHAAFNTLLSAATSWFAFEVEEFLAGRAPVLDVALDRIIPPAASSLCPTYSAKRGYRTPDPALQQNISAHYRLRLRGKHLVSCLHRILNAPSRGSRYSKANILEMATKSSDHIGLEALGARIRTALGQHLPPVT